MVFGVVRRFQLSPNMANKEPVIKFQNPTEGVVRAAAIADPVAQPNSVQEAINLNFDSMGVAIGRPGLTQYAVSPSGSNPILSYAAWLQNATTNRQLLAQQLNVIYAYITGSWVSKRTVTSTTNKARYAQFLNRTYMVNGNNGAGGDICAVYDGSAFSAIDATYLGDLINIKGDCIQAGFDGRIWIADASTDKLYYTNIVQPNGTFTTTGTPQFISNLSPQDGQSITALFRVSRALLVFKQNEIFRVYSASSLDPYPAYYVGTYSQESVIQGVDGVYFHHPTGFYKFQYDGQPQNISRRIIDFVQGISRTNYDKIISWKDADHIYWGVGNVTVKNRTYNNCVFRYTISSNVWTIYSYSKSLTAAIVYDDGTNILPLAGTSLGITTQTDLGFSDLGDEIFCEMTSRWVTFFGLASILAAITGATAVHQNCGGMKVDFQYDKEENKFNPVMALTDEYANVFPNIITSDFNRIRYRFSGSYSKALPVFETVEILQLQEQGYKQN